MSIERKCETCERGGGCGLSDCRAPDWSHHFASRDALEACLRGAEDATDAAREERDAARAQVTARDEEIATLRAQAEDWAAQYRALSASVESERAGLRHSLAEVEDERDEAVSAMEEWRARAEVAEPERDQFQKRVHALEDQIEHAGCSAAHEGERTYECRIEAPCGLCRLRTRAEAAEAEVSRLGSTAFAYRMRAYSAEARVRELEARFGAIWTVERTDRVRALRQSHPDTVGRQSDDEILGAALDDFLSSAGSEARERELEALGFERPGPSAYTCGDALGLRRLPDDEDPP